MKRTVLFVVLAIFAITAVSAHPGNRPGRNNKPGEHPRFNWQNNQNRVPRMAAEKVTVSGSLIIAKGMIAVKSNDITYAAAGLNRFIGFIDGLKEGANVTLEGMAMTGPGDGNTKFLRVQKMTLNGKEYDLGLPFQSMTPAPRPQPQNMTPAPRHQAPPNQRQMRERM